MKKSLLALGLAAVSFGAIAQGYEENTGNQAATDSDGYEFNYNYIPGESSASAETFNCMNDDGTATNIHNAQNTGGYLITHDNTIEGADGDGSAVIATDGTATNPVVIKFTTGFCSNSDANNIDVSGESTMKIRVQSDVAIRFYAAMGIIDGANLVTVDKLDGEWLDYYDVPAGEWTTLTITVGNQDGSDNSVDLTKGIGIAVRIGTAADQSVAATANVAIDWMEFGSKVGTHTETSLENQADAVNFTAYPNPATGIVNFTSDVEGTVELSNALGTTVASTTGNSMNVSELPAGVYFATLKVNGEATAVQRVQVQ